MADDMKPKESSKADDTVALIAFGAVLFGLVLIPTVLAALIYMFLLRSRLARGEFAMVALACTAGLFIGGGELFAQYFHWLGVLVVGGGSRLAVPVLPLLLFSGVLVGLAGLIDGTVVTSKLPALLKPKHSMGEKPSIIPTAREKQGVSVVAPPVLTASPALHSIDHDVEPGKRPFPIGVDSHGAPVFLTEAEIGTHALIFGATGSGKSESIKVIAAGLCDLGWSGMILDLKEDTKPGGLRDWCHLYAQHHAMPYQELRLSDPEPQFWFNALSGLSQDEARDTILSLTRFDDEYYQNVSKKVLGQLLKLMYWANTIDPVTCPAPTMYDIAQILSSPSLPAATKKMRAVVMANVPGVSDAEFQVLASPQKVEQDQATSWGAKLGNLYETQAGRTVLRTTGDRRMLEVTKPGLIYVGLDSQGKADLTKVISSAVLQRLSVDAAQRTTGTIAGPVTPKFLIVDEANWVDRTIVQNLLSRARSAGICMMLSTQGPKDWIDKDGNDFAKLGQNTNVAIIMRQGEPESAELCADYIGKVEHLSTTYSHQDGELMAKGSSRQETSHIVTPDQLRQLQVGEAVLRVGAPATRTEWVKVIRRDPETHAQALPPSPHRPTQPRIRPPKIS